MKVVLSCMLLLLLCSTPTVPAIARQKGVDRSGNGQAPAAKLELTTKVIEYRSCYPAALTLRLLFTFRNAGTENIILDKRSSVVGRHFVGSSPETLRSKKYEEEGRYEHDSGPYIPTAEVVPEDMSNFIVLAPNEVYEVASAWTQVNFTVNDGTAHARDGLRLGSHYLQVQVGTWLYATDIVAKHARRQWRTLGHLWTGPIISQPMQFTIDPNRPISKCQ